MKPRSAHNMARRTRGESGQALILWVLAATVIFVIGVIVVDFGLWLSERRRAQTAADLAALAAATVLSDPINDPVVQAKGLDFAKRNGYENGVDGASVEVDPRYGPDQVEVTVRQGSRALFLDALDIAGIDIGARAVGTRTVSDADPPPPAFLALDTGCSGSASLEISGSDVDVTGVTHSNGEILVAGSGGNFIGGTHYGCSPPQLGSNNYNPSAAPAPARQSPLPYAYSDFPCSPPEGVTLPGGTDIKDVDALWVGDDPNTKRLKSQVICADGRLVSSEAGISSEPGGVTLVARTELDISGGSFNLTAKWNQVLLFAGSNSSSAMTIQGSNGQWFGYLLAPNGRLSVSGSDGSTFNAALIGKQVLIGGGNFSVDSSVLTDPTGGEPIVHLVE